MARSTKKSATQEIAEAFNTPVNLNWCDVAEELGVTIPDLQERFATLLNDATVFSWDTIPVEHQPVVDAIARDLDASRSTRKLEPQAESPQLPEASEQPLEPPLLEDKPQSKRKGKKSTALTQRKSSSLKNSDENSQQLASTDLQVKEVLHARKGQKSGARLATIELLAEDSTYRKIKGEGLVRKVAQLTSELSAEADFDPIAILLELGIDANSDLYEDLRQQIEPALGKVESATAEIVEKAWVNGIDLETELGNLENLMNYSASTSDYWQ
ncbi:hypothetical protein [Allocoleopsis sp.]|uniref:hypothetical protein n=1 Tax=Allocoleopsis sp. TaxID=3088169 RepID=UPI002FD5A286